MNSPDFFSIVAAVLAVILLVDVSVLWLTGRQVPELLSQLIFGVCGFYFGRAPGIGTGNSAGSANGATGPKAVPPSARPESPNSPHTAD